MAVASKRILISTCRRFFRNGGFGRTPRSLTWLLVVSTLISIPACTSTRQDQVPPTITSFSAAKSPITTGNATSLTAVFDDGNGSIDHGVGAVKSGVAKSTGTLDVDTTFTLTVQGAGAEVTRTATVTVAPEPARPVITAPSTLSTGATGSASISEQMGMTYQWSITGGTFSGGSTSATGTKVSFTAGAVGSLNLNCTATNAAGDVSVAGVREIALVTDPALTVTEPVITSFVAANPTVPAGGSTTLIAIFSGGTGSVDANIGSITSGAAVSTGKLAANTTFTLTVTNATGETATAKTTVSILPVTSVITFTTEGDAFAPVIVVAGSPAILWTFADGTTSDSATPSKTYGSVAKRSTTLQVTPWSALTRINIGYDAGDGGSDAIEYVADQRVSAVQGLEVVASTLAQWCSSYNQISSLNFSNFTNLDTIECFMSSSLVSVNLTNTPELTRACFEQCSLAALDLSQSPKLADLRGASNAYSTIKFGSGIFPDTWHICIRDNPQFTNQTMFAATTQFPHLTELYIWNDNQAGELRIPSSGSSLNVIASGNHYTSVNLEGSMRESTGHGVVNLQDNQVRQINVTGCVELAELNLQNNALSSSAGDTLLATLDSLGRAWSSEWDASSALMVDLRGNATPSAAGRASAVRLAAKGWAITTDEWTEGSPPNP
jgi:hypothetical protein